jgi:mono/diheme cytochrome c family protein
MSKLLRRVFAVIAVLLGVVALLLVGIYIGSNRRLHRHYLIKPAPLAISSSASNIALGKHLVETHGCLECHGPDLAGKAVIDNPAMGLLYAPNITRGSGTVTASYQDADWVRSIRHGLNPQGRPLVLMPSTEFFELTDEDLAAIVAYVKSAPPVERPTRSLRVGPVARALILAGKFPIAAEIINHTAVHPVSITPSVSADYGRYLAVGCTGCHNPSYSGGKIDVGPPDWPPAANLTPTGRLAKWSEADFVATLRTGKRPDGSILNPIMPRTFALMNDTELKALYAFLTTLPPKATGQR